MKHQVIGSLTASLFLAAASFCAPKSARRAEARSEQQITVRIHDYAHANPTALLHAERVAGDILEQAGVAVVWLECPMDSSNSGAAACSSTMSPVDLVMNLLPHSMSDRLHKPGGVLGFALEASGKDFGFNASIFYDVVKDCVAERYQDFDELLGAAIAHELGHLLLGTNSHSSTGLMSAFWSGKQLRIADQHGLVFSDAEAKRIQAALTARMLAATVSPEATESSSVAPTEQPTSAGARRDGK